MLAWDRFNDQTSAIIDMIMKTKAQYYYPTADNVAYTDDDRYINEDVFRETRPSRPVMQLGQMRPAVTQMSVNFIARGALVAQ